VKARKQGKEAGFIWRLLGNYTRKSQEGLADGSFNEAMLNGIARQVRIRFEIQLRQDAGTVGTDSFDAEGELIGNVRNRVSGGD